MSLLDDFLRAFAENGFLIRFKRYFSWTGYEQWKMKIGGFKPQWIVIHHSWSPDNNMLRDWDGIKKFHTSWRYQGDIVTEQKAHELMGQGKMVLSPWNDVGYQFGIEEINGHVEVLNGRDIGEVGAHAVGFNDKSIGICLIGNYDKEVPSNGKLLILASLCRQLQREFDIPRDHVIGHRDTFVALGKAVEKTCPGVKFDMDLFRERLTDIKTT